SSATGRSPDFSAWAIAPSYSSELAIAFSKIDGFDVTPLTPSVSINFFRSPLATKPRARKSSQTDWPCFSSALTGFMMPCFCFELVPLRGFQHLFWRDAEFCQQVPEGCGSGEYAYPRRITPFTTYRSRQSAALRRIRRGLVAAGWRCQNMSRNAVKKTRVWCLIAITGSAAHSRADVASRHDISFVDRASRSRRAPRSSFAWRNARQSRCSL